MYAPIKLRVIYKKKKKNTQPNILVYTIILVLDENLYCSEANQLGASREICIS